MSNFILKNDFILSMGFSFDFHTNKIFKIKSESIEDITFEVYKGDKITCDKKICSKTNEQVYVIQHISTRDDSEKIISEVSIPSHLKLLFE
jgi:hypothetical protein